MPGSQPPASQHERVKALFLSALEQPRAARAAFIEAQSAGDETLRREVTALVLLHGSADSVLDHPLDPADVLESVAATAPERVGPYRLLQPLGHGGMGTVYLARHELSGAEVALKLLQPGVITPEARRRFQREAEALARLDHPGIARILDAGEDTARVVPLPWIAMERIQGVPLTQYARERSLDIRTRVELLVAVCDAVEHAHQRGVVHRDLKPGNVLVDTQARPKVLDFGVAQMLGDERPTQRMTVTGLLLGTPQYMSPEQVQAEPATVGAPSDVYALGVMAYELLADRVPYDASSVSLHRAVVVVLTHDPAPLGSIDAALRGPLERIVAKAMEKNPGARYPDAKALGDDLRRFLEGRPVSARSSGPVRRATRWAARWARRRPRTAAAVAALALVVAVGAVWWAAGTNGPSTPQVQDAYAHAEANLLDASQLLYGGERTHERLLQAVALLEGGRQTMIGMPPRSHRVRLDYLLAHDLATAELLLGQMDWDPSRLRHAFELFRRNADVVLPGPGWERDLGERQLQGRMADAREEWALSLAGGAAEALLNLTGEQSVVEAMKDFVERAYAATRRAKGPPRPPDQLRLPEDNNEPYVYRYSALASVWTEIAGRTRRASDAAQAVAYADTAFGRRLALRRIWPALSATAYVRGRAFARRGEITRSSADFDSALACHAFSAEFRGPDRPGLHAETRRAMGEVRLAAARILPAGASARAGLEAAVADLRAAEAGLPPSTHRVERASYRSALAAGLIQLGLAQRSRPVLAEAAALLDSTSRVLAAVEYPRPHAIDLVRKAALLRARAQVEDQPELFSAARSLLVRAEDLASEQTDALAGQLAAEELALLEQARTRAGS